MNHTLESLTALGFEVEATNARRNFDIEPRWYVRATKRAVERHPNGRKKQGVGTNEFTGCGDSIKLAIANMIANVNEMADDLVPSGLPLEPNTDPKTAKEQPIKAVGVDNREHTRRFLSLFGNDANRLTTLVHSGILTANEIREVAHLPPLKSAT